jgi:RNA polymerase-binding transcription factor DksA
MAKAINQKKPAAKPVKKASKPAPAKKTAAKKAAVKPAKKAPAKPIKAASKNKPVPKKTAAKKPAPAKKTAAKKTMAKAVVKKPAIKKPSVKKNAAKKPAAKPAAKKTTKAVVKSKPLTKAAIKVKPAAKPAVKTPAPKALNNSATVKPSRPESVKSILKPDIKHPEPKPVMKSTQKNPAEKPQPAIPSRPEPEIKPAANVVRYSDADLAVFKEVILKKIAKAKEEIDFYSDQIRNSSESETQFASIDDGSMTSERENMNQIVVRMQKLISHLESALVRIENKSYGICRETGKLIPKERLMVVPHATLSVEGKKMEKK